MAAETGAAGVAAWKLGVVQKGLAMFFASAAGAAMIAAFHPATRRDTWWQALGAGIGGLIFGPIGVELLVQHFPGVKPEGGDLLSWLRLAAPVLFLFGALFWGLVGALRKLRDKIADKGADVVGGKVGL